MGNPRKCLDCHEDISGSHGNRKRCEECAAKHDLAVIRNWQSEHPDDVQAADERWRKNHPEKHRQSSVNAYYNNPGKYRRYSRQYRKDHPDEVRKYDQEYRKHKSKRKKYQPDSLDGMPMHLI